MAAGVAGALNHLGVEVTTPDEVGDATRRLQRRGARDRGAAGDDLLLRGPGQGLGRGPRPHAVGGLHRARGRAGREHSRWRRDLLRRRQTSPWCLPAPAADAGVRGPKATHARVALWRRLSAEFLGSAFLAMLVIGSGIAAQQLSPGQHRAAAPGERGGHRSRPLRHHLDVRRRLGSPLQPDRVLRRCRLRRLALA